MAKKLLLLQGKCKLSLIFLEKIFNQNNFSRKIVQAVPITNGTTQQEVFKQPTPSKIVKEQIVTPKKIVLDKKPYSKTAEEIVQKIEHKSVIIENKPFSNDIVAKKKSSPGRKKVRTNLIN